MTIVFIGIYQMSGSGAIVFFHDLKECPKLCVRDVFVAQISLVQPFEVDIVGDNFRRTCNLLIDEFYTDLFIKNL